MKEEETGSSSDVLNTPIEKFFLSHQATKALKDFGIESLGQLIELTENDLTKVKNLGPKSIIEIKRYIKSKQQKFAES